MSKARAYRAACPRVIRGSSSSYGRWYVVGRVLTLLAMAVLPVQSAQAVTVTWNGTAGDGLWETGGNWTGGVPTSTTDAVLDSGLATTITSGATDTANSLTIKDSYTLSGGALTLTTGNITVTSGSTATISSALASTAGGLTLAASNGLGDTGGGTLILSGTNTYSGATTINAGVLSISDSTHLGDNSVTNTLAINGGTLQNTGATVDLGVNRALAIGASGASIDVTAANVLTLSGAVTGTGNTLTKIGTGTLVLSNASNNYGPTVISDGTLQLGANNALTSGTTLTLGDGGTTNATLDLNAFNQNLASLVLNSTGGTKTITNTSLATTSTLTVNNSASNSFGGVISGKIALIKSNTGALVLTNANTYSDGSSVGSGSTLVAGNASAFGTGAVALSGSNVSTQSGNFILANAFSLATATNNTFSVTDFADGTTARVVQSTGQWTGSGNLTVDGTGIAAGRGILSLQNTSNSPSGTLTLGANAAVENKPVTDGTNAVTTGKTIGTMAVVFQGTNALLDLRDAAANGSGATLSYGNNITLNNSGSISLNTNGGTGDNIVFGMGTLTTSGAYGLTVVNAGGNANPNRQSSALMDRAGYGLQFGATTLGGSFSIDTPNPVQFAGAISDGGAGHGFSKAGTGVATIAGGLAAGGALTVSAGELRLTSAGTVGSTAVNGGTLQVFTAPGNTLVGTGTTLSTTSVTLNGGILRFSPSPFTPTATSAGLDGSYLNVTTPSNGHDVFARNLSFVTTSGTPAAFVTRTDADINVANAVGFTGAPATINATHMAAMWNGLLNVTTPGNYTFYSQSDDGSLVYIDGTPVVLNDRDQGFGTGRNGQIYLTAGHHMFQTRYSQGTGNGGIIVSWASQDAGITKTVIPAANFFTTTDNTNLSTAHNISVTAGSGSYIDAAGANVTNTGTIVVGSGGTGGTLGLYSSTFNTFTNIGTVTLGGPTTIRSSILSTATGSPVDAFASIVTLDGAIVGSDASASFTKSGPGALTLSGTTANTLTTQYGVTQGVLTLNKTAGVDAVGAGGIALNSNGIPASAASTVSTVLQLNANEQINNAGAVSLNSGGFNGNLFNLNDFNETISSLTLTTTTASGSRVLTGASGVLAVNGNLTFNSDRNATGNTGRELIVTGTGAVGGTAYASSGTLDLGGTARTITVASVAPSTILDADATIEAVIQNGGIIKEGSRRLRLAGTNTFAGNIVINNGILALMTGDANLGASTNTITINGTGGIGAGGYGANNNAVYVPPASRIFTFGAGANASIEVTKPGTGNPSTGKINTTFANQLTGGGASTTITKIGLGDLQLSAANNVVSNWIVNEGVLEFQNDTALGPVTNTVAVNTGGELVLTGPATGTRTFAYPLTLNGGVLSANGTNSTISNNPRLTNGNTTTAATLVTSNVNITANSTISLREFQTTGNARHLTISGNLSNTTAPTAALSINAPAAATLVLMGNNSAFTGPITGGNNVSITAIGANAIASASAITMGGGTLRTVSNTATTLGSAGVIGSYYNSNLGDLTGNPNTFAVEQLYLQSRFAGTRTDTDPNVVTNVPTAINYLPATPVPGLNSSGEGVSVQWKGLLNITGGGAYTFNHIGDDSWAVFVDGTMVTSRNGANVAVQGVVNLDPGSHTLVVRMSNGGGQGHSLLKYSGPDTSNVLVNIGSVSGSLTTGVMNTLALPAMTMTGGNLTQDITQNTTVPTLALNSSNTFTTTSYGIDTFTVLGGTTIGSGINPTFAPTTAKLVLQGNISGAGTNNVTMAGPYLMEWRGTQSYSGLTTVSGGELDLYSPTANGGIPGNLSITAANASGYIANVRHMGNDQIANASAVSLSNFGVLDLNGFTDTVGSLSISSANAQVIGGSTLTVGDLSTSAMSAGRVRVNLAGGLAGQTLTKTGTGNLYLAGNNSFIADTDVNAGSVTLAGTNSLGAATNNVSLAAGATLNFTGDKSQTLGTITATSATAPNLATLRNLFGTNTLNANVALAGGTVVNVISDAGSLAITGTVTSGDNTSLAVSGNNGDVVVSSVPSIGTGTISKSGNGFLIFNTSAPLGAVPTVTVTGGGLGFGGAQSLGALPVPAGTSYKFISDPGAGTTLAMTGGTVVAPAAINSAFIGRINSASTGVLALSASTSTAIDLATGNLDVSLGANPGTTLTYSGTLTPNSGAYRLGGGGGSLVLAGTTLSGANGLNVSGNVDLTQVRNTFSGAINLNAGITAILNDQALGTPGAVANTLTGNGGTLRIHTNYANQTGTLFTQINRQVTVGNAGFTIETPQNSSATLNSAAPTLVAASGTATLTKTGYGSLFIMNGASTYNGKINVASQGGVIDVRGNASLPLVGDVVIGQNSFLNIDNNGGLGSFPNSAGIPDRFNDAAIITLQGGRLMYNGRNTGLSGTSSREIFGQVIVDSAQSEIRAETSGGGGGDLIVTTLRRDFGAGIVRLTGENTLGNAGDNGRITISNINTTGTPVAMTATNLIGGWAINGTGHWASYTVPASVGAAGGVGTSTYVATTAANDNGPFVVGNVVNQQHDVLLTGPKTIRALRMGDGATRVLTFTGGTDLLNIVSGGILSSDNNNTRTIGSSTTRGQITAGGTTPGANPQELFVWVNQGTTTIESTIVDNPNDPAATVKLVKGLGSTVVLGSANTYTGGTAVFGGTLTANVASGLGTGAVTVRNGRMQINAPGAINTLGGTNTNGYTVTEGGEVFLNLNSAPFNTSTDRFTIDSNSVIMFNNNGTAGNGGNALTRVSSLTGGGQVVLAPGAIVGHNTSNNNENNGAGVNSIQNLGTAADLYYGLTGSFTQVVGSVTVGSGTPWKGVSTDRSDRTFEKGIIYANSDFILQGMMRNGGFATLTLGATNNSSAPMFVNNSGRAINAYIQGNVAFSDDTPTAMPSDMTLVVTSGSTLFANRSNQFGIGSSVSPIIVQAGGTLDPGAFVSVGAAANQPVGVPYPVPGPLNTTVTIQAGGRLVANDTSGIGSGALGSINLQRDAIVFIGTSTQALLGAVPGQIVAANGAIARFEQSNVLNLAALPSNIFIETTAGDREMFNQTQITTPVGLAAPENFVMNGGGILNDSNDRTFNGGFGGRFIIGAAGATFASTTSRTLVLNDDFDLAAGATVNIGSADYIDGNPRLGVVALGSVSNTANNRAGVGSIISVVNGAQLRINGGKLAHALQTTNVFPDLARLDLPTTLGAGTGSVPGVGSTVRLNNSDNIETIGSLTGNGAVLSDQGNSALQVGFDNTSFTFAGTFSSTGGNQPGLIKIGTGNMTMTGVSTSTANFAVNQGILTLAGAANTAFNNIYLGKSGTLVLDNSDAAGGAVSNRLNSTASRVLLAQGGSLNLIGNESVAVNETINVLSSGSTTNYATNAIAANHAGGYGFVNITPTGGTPAQVNLTINTIDSSTGAGQRNSTWVFRGTGMTGTPNTPAANARVLITNPNFYANGGNVQPTATTGITNAAGSSVALTRGDLLVDAAGTGATLSNNASFATMDSTTSGLRARAASEYASTILPNVSSNASIRLSGAAAISGDTRISTLTLAGAVNTITTSDPTLPFNSTPSRLYLNAGGILAQDGTTSTINSPYLDRTGGMALSIHTLGSSVVNINSTIIANQGLVKTGPGTLNLGAGALTYVTGAGLTINEGNVVLNASNNTILYAVGTNSFTGQNLSLNGGALDLNGNSQSFNNFNSNNPLSGMGGILTNTSGIASTVHIQGTSVFSGSINGNINLVKAGGNNVTLTGSSAYTGATTIRGNNLFLRDFGQLTSSNTFNINYGQLVLDNTGLAAVNNRIPTGSTINSNAGQLIIWGAADTTVTQSVATLNALQCMTTLQLNPGSSGAVDLTIGNLTRVTGAGVNFTTAAGTLGNAGSTWTSPHIYVNNIGGNPVSANSILPGWAVVNGIERAYNGANGITALNNTAGGAPGYTSTNLVTAISSDDVRITGTPSGSIAAKTVNSLTTGGAATVTLAGQLNLTSGSFISGGQAVTITGSSLTTSASELFAHVNASTTTIASQITGGINFVKSLGGTLNLTGNNNYTGTTYAAGGTLNLSTAAANQTTTVSIPGDLVIYNTTVAETITGQIKNSSNVTLNGQGVLTLFTGTPTLNSLTFRGIGSNAGNQPTLNGNSIANTTLTLTGASVANVIDSNNDHVGVTPTIAGNLTLNFAAPNINVTTSDPVRLGLIINGVINNVPGGGLNKLGAGVLALGGANTFGSPGISTNVLNVNNGIVRADVAGSLGASINAVTTVNASGTLLGAVNGTIGASINLNGGTLGATQNNWTLGTATTTAGSASVLTVSAASNIRLGDYFQEGITGRTITHNGLLTGSGNLNLIGPGVTSATGTFTLANPITSGLGLNDYSGAITINTNAVLLSSPNKMANAGATGSALGTATINLNGGRLSIRDDGNTAATATGATIVYGNNINLTANSFIDADRANGTSATNIVEFGTLNVASGTHVLSTDFTGNPITNQMANGYQISFTQIDGPGTLVKAGHEYVNINGYAGSAAANFVVAPASGLAVRPSGNLQLNAATNNIGSLTVGGVHTFLASKTVNMTGTFAVSGSPTVVNGTNGVTAGSAVGGAVLATDAVVTAATLQNDGNLGASGANTSVTATTIQGQGFYQTLGQPLNITGKLADTSGSVQTILKVAGNSTVNLNVTAAGTSTGGAEVQSGTLVVKSATAATPITNPLGTGVIKVYASPASTLGTNSQPVAATSGTLQLDASNGDITHNNAIVNNGTVNVSSGTVNVAGNIGGTALTYVPGLLEGTSGSGFDASATRFANPGNFGIKLEPRMGQTNTVSESALSGWSSNTQWVYTGQFYDADGIFTFAENIDDNVLVSIDGVNRLVNNTGTESYRAVTSTSVTGGQRGNTIDAQTGTAPALVGGNTAANFGTGGPLLNFGMGANNDGWHSIEIRFRNGGGGAGPTTGNGFFANYGFGLNTSGTTTLDGSQFLRPIDNGTGTLFRTAVGGKGNINVAANSILNAGSITQTNRLSVGAGATSAVNLNGAAASTIDNVDVTGTSGSVLLSTNATSSATVGNVTVANGTTLNHTGAANRMVITGNASSGVINSTTAQGLTFNSNSAQAASSLITGSGGLVKEGSGTLTLHSANTYTGATNITGGTVKLGGGWGGTGSPFTNVAEASKFRTVYKLSIPDNSDFDVTIPYSEDHSTDNTIDSGSFNRVAYFMELKKPADANSTWVWVSMDASPFTTDLTKMGIPTAANGIFYHYDAAGLLPGQVRNMNVATNAVSGVTAGTNIATGNVEFWPSNYGATNGYGVPGADDATYDFGDGSANGTTTGHGSMQIHNYGTGETLMSLARFNNNAASTLFIGNDTGTNPDGTFNENSASYSIKDLWVLVGNSNGGPSILPSTTPVTISDNSALDLNGNNQTIASLTGTSLSSVQLGSGTLTTGDATSTTFAGVISGGGNLIKTGGGTFTLSNTNTHTGATTVSQGTLRVDGSVATSTGVTVATGATFVAGATQVVKTLDLSAATSNASILAGAIRVLSVGDNTAASPLTLTGGKMDLNTSALIVDFTAGNEPANLAAVKTAILAGRGTGVWDGTSGLTSSAAAAASTVYGVGYAPSSIATATIAGVTPDADAVVARYTRLGDANLDGAVNFFDLTALAAAYGGAGEWYNGDFDYSGTINFFDLTALAANYGTGLPSEAIPGATPEFSADLAAAFASVPEPGAISLLGLAALALLNRRNRKAA